MTVVGFSQLVPILVLSSLVTFLRDLSDGAAVYTLAAATAAVLIWQTVGTIRSGARYVHETGDINLAIAVFTGQVISAFVGLLLVLDFAADRFERPPIKEISVLPVSADDLTVQLVGQIDFGLNTAFRETLRVHPTIRRTVLSSDGGRIFAARAIAKTILDFKLDSVVLRQCYSA